MKELVKVKTKQDLFTCSCLIGLTQQLFPIYQNKLRDKIVFENRFSDEYGLSISLECRKAFYNTNRGYVILFRP